MATDYRKVASLSDETRQVPSIVKLRPYRYFPEADQVEVPLLLRHLHSRQGERGRSHVRQMVVTVADISGCREEQET